MTAIPAIVLAGGLGTRLRSIEPNKPKPMVEIFDKPFLYWLIQSLDRVGFDHFIFSIGYKADFIESYPWVKEFPTKKFEFVTEVTPLGTGGAVKNVFDLDSAFKEAWVINGDTILEKPLPPEKPSSDEVLYTVLNKKNVFDAKPNLVTKGDRVAGVSDKEGIFFDGGQVFVTREAVDSYGGPLPVSFHEMILESFERKKVGFRESHGTCYDIGTPERLKRFELYLKGTFIAR